MPTVTDVDRIAALGDPVLRNLQITQCYHELSAAVVRRTGTVANWCTFATWASKQAGQSIRREDLARTLEATLNTEPAVWQAIQAIASAAVRIGSTQNSQTLPTSIWNALAAAAVDRTSDAVARGNRKVFEEIGHAFARFNSTCLRDPVFDAESITQFCIGLRSGTPPDGQQFLRTAFTRYYHGFFAFDNRERAELLLLANIEIGFHEQTRLQPEIAESLTVPVVDPKEFTSRLLDVMFPDRGWLARTRLWLLRLVGRLTHFDEAVESFVTVARRHLRTAITAHLMTMSFPPDVRLRLGQDLTAEFPANLKELHNPDLLDRLQQIDPTPNSVRESGAVDWADLPDRLHFIIDLFRCYQETVDLFEGPFSSEQVTSLKADRVPGGRL